MGGFSYIATLMKRLRSGRRTHCSTAATPAARRARPGWSTRRSAGVDVMQTPNWPHGVGVKEVVERDFAGRIDFIAKRAHGGLRRSVLAYVIKRITGVATIVARLQARRSPTALLRARVDVRHPGYGCRRASTTCGPGAQNVPLSHNGMDVDLVAPR
jgi:hypothetical protein